MLNLKSLYGAEEGNDVFVVGTGTSLANFDFSILDDRRTVALNDAVFHFVPTYHFFTDQLWNTRYARHRYDRRTAIVCRKHAARFAAQKGWRVYEFRGSRKPSKGQLYVFATVAAAAIHFAQVLGARRTFLLGVDAYRTTTARYLDGRLKANRKVYKVRQKTVDGRLIEKHHQRWCRAIAEMRQLVLPEELGSFPGPGVYNLNPKSTVEVFEKVDPAQVFAAQPKGAPTHADTCG